jgi:hypothetical protein
MTRVDGASRRNWLVAERIKGVADLVFSERCPNKPTEKADLDKIEWN